MKPVLSEHRIKRTPFIKRTVVEVPKFISLIYFKWNLYKADTSIKRTRTPKRYLKWSFLLLPTRIKRTLVIKFHHPTCQTSEMRKIASDYHPQIFRFFHLKAWLDELIWLVLPECIVFYFVLFVYSLFHSSDFFKFELQSMFMVPW